MQKSSSKSMTSRWAVEVEGHHVTVTRLESYLNGSLLRDVDTFVARLREVPVLRSQLWDKVNDATLVEQLAQTELALLQGLTKIAGGASPLGVGTIFEVGAGDIIVRQTRNSLNNIDVLSRDTDPTAVFRQRMDVVRRHDALGGAVIELSGRADWIKVYKAVEYLEEHFGGERQLIEAIPNRKNAIKRIKRTAQSMRHRARAFENIDNPFKLEDAENLLQLILKDIIASIAPGPVAGAPSTYFVPKRDFTAEEVIGLTPLVLVNGEQSEVALAGDTLTVN